VRLILILLVLLSSAILVSGQSYTWDSYTTDASPLRSNNLNALSLDSDGVLWIGSDSGLTGFNGAAWITYNTPSVNLADDSVITVRIDDQSLLLGTKNGLSSGQASDFDNISWEAPYRMNNSDLIFNKINSMNIDSLGFWWICTDSGVTVITDTGWVSASASSEFYLSSNKVLAINQQPTYMQYVGTESGGVSRLYLSDVDGITGASTLWKQWTTFPDTSGRIQPGLLSDTVKAILIDHRGDRWYGTEYGISTHTGEFLKNPFSWRSFTTDIGMVHNNVQVLAEDSTGAIWIGTSGGVSKLIPADTSWTNFTVDDGIVSNDVRDIIITPDGVIWFATAGGLSKLKIQLNSIDKDDSIIAKSFQVHPAYPNPFNMSTTIEFNLNIASHVNIKIYDINGREVTEIINSNLLPGNYQARWNGRSANGNYIASGVYFAKISAINRTSLLKLVLVK